MVDQLAKAAIVAVMGAVIILSYGASSNLSAGEAEETLQVATR